MIDDLIEFIKTTNKLLETVDKDRLIKLVNILSKDHVVPVLRENLKESFKEPSNLKSQSVDDDTHDTDFPSTVEIPKPVTTLPSIENSSNKDKDIKQEDKKIKIIPPKTESVKPKKNYDSIKQFPAVLKLICTQNKSINKAYDMVFKQYPNPSDYQKFRNWLIKHEFPTSATRLTKNYYKEYCDKYIEKKICGLCEKLHTNTGYLCDKCENLNPKCSLCGDKTEKENTLCELCNENSENIREEQNEIEKDSS